MKITDIAEDIRPRYAKFDTIGTGYTGIITAEPEWRPDHFNDDQEVLVVPIQAEDGAVTVFMRSAQMREALRDAVTAAGASEVEVGGRLSITYVSDRGRMKVYKVRYTPPRAQPTWGTSHDASGARSFSEPLHIQED